MLDNRKNPNNPNNSNKPNNDEATTPHYLNLRALSIYTMTTSIMILQIVANNPSYFSHGICIHHGTQAIRNIIG